MCLCVFARACALSSKGTNEANILCGDLGCGTTKEIPSAEIMSRDGFDTSAKMRMECSSIREVEHLWQCATTAGAQECSHPATVICTGRTLFQGLAQPWDFFKN